LKKTFTVIACLIISALILSAAPVLSHSDKAGETVKLTATQEPPLVAGQLIDSPRQDPELSRRLRKYDLIRMDPAAVAAQVRTRGKLSLRTSKVNFDLQLTANDLRAPNYSAQIMGADGIAQKLPKTPVNTFKGTVKGSEGGQARMTVTEHGVEGAIITGNKRYFIQPARDLSTNAKHDEFVFYEASELTGENNSCGVTLADEVAAREELAAARSKDQGTSALTSPVSPLSPLKIAQLATDADAEYVTALGGATQANNQIMSIMNMVDGIYQIEIGVTFQIVFQNAWTNSATDPYTSTVASTRLEEFEDRWNSDPMFQNISRSLAHLWTDVDVTGGAPDFSPDVIGVAEVAVVCRFPAGAYGLSQRFTGNSITSRTISLTAHEMGHNFAAFHTNQANEFVPPDVERACEETIMEARIGDGSAFCAFSRSEIMGHANAFSFCLTDSVSGPPIIPSCVETPIDGTGLTANGALANTDCRSTFRGVNHFADQFSFNGTAGQRVSITMVHTSGSLDPYLFLIGPDGYPVSQDDDGNGNSDSRIPGSGTIALPMTGKYVLEATSFLAQQTGNYTITVTQSGCTLSVSASNQHFSSVGGGGTITVTATGACGASYQFAKTPSTEAWLTTQVTGGTGSQSLAFNVAANPNTAGRRAFLLVGPSLTDFSGGLSIPITQSGSGQSGIASDCSVTPIAFGQTLNGSLAGGDCHSPIRGNGFLADRYTFNATAGQKVAISISSNDFDTFLELMGPNSVVLIKDDDSGGNITNSRIPGGTGMLTLGTTGTYTIEVTAFDTSESGAYALTLLSTATGTIQLSQPSFSIVESQASMNVTVTRTGDISGTATVDYATSDTAGTQTCPTTNGQASSRCDYITTLGTLTFAVGETSKTILVPIVDDVHIEGSESFTMTLSNVAPGATLGTPTATLTITESEAGGQPNPIDNSSLFVRQHYLDFLNREPDAAGLAFWIGEIENCTPKPQCIEVKRINVSAAFFLSIEFQETGYLVYRIYKSAFGNLAGKPVPVRFTDFLRDTQRIREGVEVGIGNWQAQLEANKQAFALAFVQRGDFKAAYLNTLPPDQFVNQMNANAGGALSPTEINNLIATLTVPSDPLQRARVLRAVAEDQTLRDAESNRAFVLMQYFGYLRRNPDDVGFDGNPDPAFNGFNFWLNKLNQFNGNFEQAEMVKAFILSIEYRQRFGQ
jgi:Metallo-peptidase family M12/Calx-beta domain/Reprolysin family propeptide/Domain of unknown function (DUF4214)